MREAVHLVVRLEVATVHWQSAQAYAWPLGLAVVVGGIGAWLILWIYHRLKGRDRDVRVSVEYSGCRWLPRGRCCC